MSAEAVKEQEIVSLDNIEIDESKSLFVEGGLDPYKEMVKEAYEYVKSLNLDMNNPDDRKALNSWSRKFGSLSSRVTKLGVADRSGYEEAKKKSKAVEKDFTELVDSCKANLRAPLDEWIEKDKARVQALEDRVKQITELGMAKMVPAPKLESSQYKERMDALNSIEVDESFEELLPEAEEEYVLAKRNLEALYKQAVEEEKEKAELEELRRQKAKAEREKEVKEAAERARKEAEEKAEKEKREAIEKVEREAREKAEKLEAERKAKEAEAKRRAEDEEHQRKINNEALASMVAAVPIEESVAKRVLSAIAKGNIKNVSINY